MIYTHVPLPCRKSRGWPYLEVSHLVADETAELVHFVARLGISADRATRERGRRLFFAISRSNYKRAVRMGAEVVSIASFTDKLLPLK